MTEGAPGAAELVIGGSKVTNEALTALVLGANDQRLTGKRLGGP